MLSCSGLSTRPSMVRVQLPGSVLAGGIPLLRMKCRDVGVMASVEARGLAESVEVRARYVIAADGAGSRLRDQLDIEMDGPEVLQHHMMIHFEADLTELTRDRPGVLYFCMDPHPSGAFIAYGRSVKAPLSDRNALAEGS